MRSYPDSMPKSREMFERALRVMPGGNTRTTVFIDPFPIYADRGEGPRIWDVDGNVYYDCINNFTAMIHGYGHPDVTAAVMDQLPHGTAFGAPTKSELDLAELLVQRLPSVDQIRFANSGTEAVMMAIKAARAFTDRPKIVKIEGAYHGSYDFAEVSLDSSPMNWGDMPVSTAYAKGTPKGVLEDVIAVPFNDIEALRAVFDAQGDSIAGVLIDPMPNRAGLIPARKEYLDAIVEIAHAADSLVIFDEVISLRLGLSGAQGLWDIKPDITALGKIIGGGFPVGAVGGRAEVMAVFDPTHGKPALPHGGTFTANPVTMRAGLAAMRALTPASFAHLDAIGSLLRDGINASLRRRGLKGQCVGLGSLFKVHFTPLPITDYRSVYPGVSERKKLDRFHKGLIDRGVLSASYGLFALSTSMTEDDAQEILSAIDGALAEIATLK
ncbi:aspartate aminotransferase family protein (plasmid) [Mesorhizobium sp. 131-2-5]|uniref:aspartate aminotransferase family protein n=1 Tax=Mesorhizobium sp. 131-2-5 TaxID=2744519 RepID=UPI0018EDB0F2|nr:aspartate aminotransferase family protein [Mesorhizobium sp. 131-2-5]BCH05166.1 aspartate aminotransferase family protein [Mesorhizobium sp. 131-2-5]